MLAAAAFVPGDCTGLLELAAAAAAVRLDRLSLMGVEEPPGEVASGVEPVRMLEEEAVKGWGAGPKEGVCCDLPDCSLFGWLLLPVVGGAGAGRTGFSWPACAFDDSKGLTCGDSGTGEAVMVPNVGALLRASGWFVEFEEAERSCLV